MERPDPRWPSLGYWVSVTVAVAATIILVLAARQLASVAMLVLIAGVLAVGLDPLVRALERRGLRRGLAVAIIAVIGVAGVVGFVVAVVPPLVRQATGLADDIPGYVAQLSLRDDWIGRYARDNDLATQLRDFVRQAPAAISGSFGAILGFTGQVVAGLFNAVTVLILAIYFLSALPRMRRVAPALFDEPYRERGARLIDASVRKIGGYVVGNLLTSLVCAVAALIALLAIGVPFAVPLAVWAGLADLLPVVGAYLGALPAVVVAAFVSPADGLWTLVYFLVYQQVENYLIQPRVMRDAVDLSPAAVIISTLAGALLAGFAGALLALPVAATIKVVVNDVWLAGRLSADPDR
ncbi:MAG: AI-2E family transporter [Actinomycetota bacterium]